MSDCVCIWQHSYIAYRPARMRRVVRVLYVIRRFHVCCVGNIGPNVSRFYAVVGDFDRSRSRPCGQHNLVKCVRCTVSSPVNWSAVISDPICFPFTINQKRCAQSTVGTICAPYPKILSMKHKSRLWCRLCVCVRVYVVRMMSGRVNRIKALWCGDFGVQTCMRRLVRDAEFSLAELSR